MLYSTYNAVQQVQLHFLFTVSRISRPGHRHTDFIVQWIFRELRYDSDLFAMDFLFVLRSLRVRRHSIVHLRFRATSFGLRKSQQYSLHDEVSNTYSQV